MALLYATENMLKRQALQPSLTWHSRTLVNVLWLAEPVPPLFVRFVSERHSVLGQFLIIVLIIGNADGNVALDALFKADHGVGGVDAGNLLYAVVEQILQMLVLARIQLDEHGVGACREMAFHHLGNLHQFLHHGIVHAALLKPDADIRTGSETQVFGIYLISASGDGATVEHPHHTLVDGRSRHTALLGNFLETPAGIDGNHPENLTV